MATSVPKFNFLAPLVTEIWRGRKIKMGAADLPKRPLADKLLHAAIVPANGYQRTKFQLSSSISCGDMRGSQNKKWSLLISTDGL